MGSSASVVYLHGVGDDGSSRDWATELPAGTEIVAPHWGQCLTKSDRDVAADSTSAHLIPQRSPRRDRDAYRRRQAWLAGELVTSGADVRKTETSLVTRLPDTVDRWGQQAALKFIYPQVGRFLNNFPAREKVAQAIANQLPSNGRVVLIGHSLGAIVALDVLQILPTRIELLVTAAAPLARPQLLGPALRLRHTFPHAKVGMWINAFNPSDVVTRGRPIGGEYSQVIDVAVAGTWGDHSLRCCLTEPAIAELVTQSLTSGIGDPHGQIPTAPSQSAALTALNLGLTSAVEELVATAPGITPRQVHLVQSACQVIRERSQDEPNIASWSRHEAQAVRLHIAEADVPDALLHLATVDPFNDLRVEVPPEVLAAARNRVAAAATLPAAWLKLAREISKDMLQQGLNQPDLSTGPLAVWATARTQLATRLGITKITK